MSERCAGVEPLHSAWLDGVLRPDEAARVAGHVAGCHTCRDEVEALDRTRRLLGNLPVRRAPSALLSTPAPGIGARLRRRPGALTRGFTALLVAAGTVVGAAFALGAPQEHHPTVPVPVEMFVADHLVRTVGGHVGTPLVVDATP